MKKAKIFLTALTVLAVLGGALAFKAKTLKPFAQCDTAPSIKLCTLETTFLGYITTTTTTAQIIPYDEPGDPCVLVNGVWTCTTRAITE